MSLLPKTKRPPQIDIDRLVVFLYGPPKIGKSTTFSRIPGALFLAFERGLDALEVYETPCPDWETFTAVLDELKRGSEYSTIGIDTIDEMYNCCMTYWCRMNKVEHPTLARDPRTVYGQINSAMKRAIGDLATLGKGLWFISHEREELVEIGGRKNVQVVRPTLSGSIRTHTLGMADLVLRAGVGQHEKRLLWCQPTRTIEAGDRTGLLPPTIPLKYQILRACLDGSLQKAEAEKKKAAEKSIQKEADAKASKDVAASDKKKG